jgi:predicted nucleic acid-binding protein
MKILLDTNVVARLFARVGDNSNVVASRAVARLRNDRHELFLLPQVLYEFWVIATRPADQNGFGMPPIEMLKELEELQTLFTLLRDERSVFDRWQALVAEHKVIGKAAHDARLVAGMYRHALSHVLTFNVVDFKRYSAIEILDANSLGQP